MLGKISELSVDISAKILSYELVYVIYVFRIRKSVYYHSCLRQQVDIAFEHIARRKRCFFYDIFSVLYLLCLM